MFLSPHQLEKACHLGVLASTVVPKWAAQKQWDYPHLRPVCAPARTLAILSDAFLIRSHAPTQNGEASILLSVALMLKVEGREEIFGFDSLVDLPSHTLDEQG